LQRTVFSCAVPPSFDPFYLLVFGSPARVVPLAFSYPRVARARSLRPLLFVSLPVSWLAPVPLLIPRSPLGLRVSFFPTRRLCLGNVSFPCFSYIVFWSPRSALLTSHSLRSFNNLFRGQGSFPLRRFLFRNFSLSSVLHKSLFCHLFHQSQSVLYLSACLCSSPHETALSSLFYARGGFGLGAPILLRDIADRCPFSRFP